MPERARPLHVVQVSFHADHQRRDAESLMSAWPIMPAVAAAVARAGVKVTIVQAAHADEMVQQDGVDFHFVNDVKPRRSRVSERVRSLSPDVVHVQGLHHGRAVGSLARAVRATPCSYRTTATSSRAAGAVRRSSGRFGRSMVSRSRCATRQRRGSSPAFSRQAFRSSTFLVDPASSRPATNARHDDRLVCSAIRASSGPADSTPTRIR